MAMVEEFTVKLESTEINNKWTIKKDEIEMLINDTEEEWNNKWQSGGYKMIVDNNIVGCSTDINELYDKMLLLTEEIDNETKIDYDIEIAKSNSYGIQKYKISGKCESDMLSTYMRNAMDTFCDKVSPSYEILEDPIILDVLYRSLMNNEYNDDLIQMTPVAFEYQNNFYTYHEKSFECNGIKIKSLTEGINDMKERFVKKVRKTKEFINLQTTPFVMRFIFRSASGDDMHIKIEVPFYLVYKSRMFITVATYRSLSYVRQLDE